uniref:Uncharacterized protein n=1 Tax=Chenopodium quinoa TaxID=63459 RepID=A0A803LRZ4_CHEQI
LGKVKDFLGLISEANKTLQLNAKDKPEEFDIEVLHGNESEYIEMELMLGVADLQTPEAMEAAEAAMAGNQPVGSSKEHSDMLVDGSPRQQSESRTKRKQPKIVVLP